MPVSKKRKKSILRKKRSGLPKNFMTASDFVAPLAEISLHECETEGCVSPDLIRYPNLEENFRRAEEKCGHKNEFVENCEACSFWKRKFAMEVVMTERFGDEEGWFPRHLLLGPMKFGSEFFKMSDEEIEALGLNTESNEG